MKKILLFFNFIFFFIINKRVFTKKRYLSTIGISINILSLNASFAFGNIKL